MSLSVHMRRDDAHVSIASLLKSISKSLPAGTSLQQRVALTSTLDSFYTTRALVDGLIDAQRISQDAPVSCLTRSLQVAAALHCSTTDAGTFERLLGSVILPFLACQEPCCVELHSQVAQAVADVIWQHKAWDAAAVILHRCALQLPACKVQMCSSVESSLAALNTSVPATQPQGVLKASIGSLESMPLSAVSHLVKSLLQQRESADPNQTLESIAHVGSLHNGSRKPGATGNLEGAANVQALAIALLSRWSLGALTSADDAVRETALRSFLPVLASAAGRLGAESGQHVLQSIWEQCRFLVRGPDKQQHIGVVLKLLSQMPDLLLPSCPAAQPDTGSCLDISTSPEFWFILQSAMGSTETSLCKYGLYLLRAALPPAAQKAPPWSTFLVLYELLDEYALHLIQGAWERHIEALHPGRLDPASDQGLHSKAARVDPDNEQHFDAGWVQLLWQRGFQHSNPQVQRYILRSFLLRDWSPAQLESQLSSDFVAHIFLPAVTRPSTLIKDQAEHFTAEACSLLGSYIQAISAMRQQELLALLLEECAHARAVPRITRRATVGILAAMARSAEPIQDAAWNATVLRHLQDIASSLHFYSNPALTKYICRELVTIATALAQPPFLDLTAAGQFLEQLPQEAGPASLEVLRGWLVNAPEGRLSSQSWYWDQMTAKLSEYFKVERPQAQPQPVTAREVEEWRHTAERWTKLLRLSAGCDQDMSTLLMQQIQEHALQLYRRPHLPRGIAERTLILLHTLFEKLESSGGDAAGDRSTLATSMVALAVTAAEELSSYCNTLRQVFLEPVQVSAPLQQQSWPASGQDSLPASMQADLRRAELCLGCCASGALAIQWDAHPASPPLMAWAKGIQELTEALAGFLQSFASRPCPPPSPKRDGQGIDRQIVNRHMEMHAAAMRCMAVACSGLDKSALALQTTGSPASPAALQLDLEGLMQSLMTHPMSHILAEEECFRLSPATEALKWQAAAGALGLAQTLRRRGHASLQSATSIRVLADVVEALQTADSQCLLPLLACLRLALAHMMTEPALLTAAAVALAPFSEGNCLPDPMDEGHCLALVIGISAQVAWSAIQECQQNSKRLPLLSALLSAIFQRQLFDRDWQPNIGNTGRQLLHGPQGPLQGLLNTIMDAAERSPQLIAAAAVHLCGLWVRYPAQALRYLDIWEKLLLYGGTSAAPQHPGAQIFEDYQSDVEVQEAKLSADMAARVTAVTALSQLAELSSHQRQLPDGDPADSDAHHAGQLGLLLWDRMMARALEGDDTKSASGHRPGSLAHRVRVRTWQALCALSPFLTAQRSRGAFDVIWCCVEAGNMATVRQYQEAIIVNLMLQYPEVLERHVLPALLRYETRWEGIPSVILSTAHFLLHCEAAVRERLLVPILEAIVPWTMHHHHATRAFAQLVTSELLERYPSESGIAQNRVLANMQQFLATNRDLQAAKQSIGPCISRFDPELACQPQGIFCKGVQLIGRPEEGPGIEGAPQDLLDRVTRYLVQERGKLRADAADNAAGAEADVKSADRQRKPGNESRLAPDSSAVHEASRSISAVQAILGDGPQDLGEGASKKRQELIVVASLLDKAPNLAGLSRTCEVFQASALVLADLRVLKDPAFLAVSMTAQLWVPLLEVPERDLLRWLREKQAAGYRLVGLEQTVESQPLPEYPFVEKSVLVLGRESSGIPPQILQALDCCVEIPQGGVVRSLNVHVSGAIAVYEYTRRHGFS